MAARAVWAVRAGKWDRHAVFFCLVGKWSPEDRGMRKMSGRTTLRTHDQGVELEMVSSVVGFVSQVRKPRLYLNMNKEATYSCKDSQHFLKNTFTAIYLFVVSLCVHTCIRVCICTHIHSRSQSSACRSDSLPLPCGSWG